MTDYIEFHDWQAIGLILGSFAIMFFAGLILGLIYQRRTIRQLREQASADAEWINHLREQVDAKTRNLMAEYRQAVSHVAQDSFQAGVVSRITK